MYNKNKRTINIFCVSSDVVCGGFWKSCGRYYESKC